MKAPKEYRSWLKRMIKRYGKRNGRLPSQLFDIPEFERKLANNKRLKCNQTYTNIDGEYI